MVEGIGVESKSTKKDQLTAIELGEIRKEGCKLLKQLTDIIHQVSSSCSLKDFTEAFKIFK